MKAWHGEGMSSTSNEMVYQQGVVIELSKNIFATQTETHSCLAYFSDRTKYKGPRETSDPVTAMQNHVDLGCGYRGNFDITCTKQEVEGVLINGVQKFECVPKVDISTCIPPSYGEALDSCYDIPVLRTAPPLESPQVPDWLKVDELPFQLAPLPEEFSLTKPTQTPGVCCEVHVASLCEPERNFPQYGAYSDGRWEPSSSYNGSNAYFPLIECGNQPNATIRPCPRVAISRTEGAKDLLFPQCQEACSLDKALLQLQKLCNETARPEKRENELASHERKIKSMRDHKLQLETWTLERSPKVTETLEVVDCMEDIPRRFNSLGNPVYQSNFEKLRLHRSCRVHGCKNNQCLRVRRPCEIPPMHSEPELARICRPPVDPATFECVDKITIMSNNPLSLGIGIGWAGLALIMCCGIPVSMYYHFFPSQRDNTVLPLSNVEEAGDDIAPHLLSNRGGQTSPGPRDAGWAK